MSTICQLHADLRYYLCMEPVDMRKQFHGLQGIINAEFGRYITQDEAFIFIGKTGTTAKILHREHGGLTLYVRKLSRGRFHLPDLDEDGRTCTLKYRDFVRLVLGEKWEIERIIPDFPASPGQFAASPNINEAECRATNATVNSPLPNIFQKQNAGSKHATRGLFEGDNGPFGAV